MCTTDSRILASSSWCFREYLLNGGRTSSHEESDNCSTSFGCVLLDGLVSKEDLDWDNACFLCWLVHNLFVGCSASSVWASLFLDFTPWYENTWNLKTFKLSMQIKLKKSYHSHRSALHGRQSRTWNTTIIIPDDCNRKIRNKLYKIKQKILTSDSRMEEASCCFIEYLLNGGWLFSDDESDNRSSSLECACLDGVAFEQDLERYSACCFCCLVNNLLVGSSTASVLSYDGASFFMDFTLWYENTHILKH